MCVCVSFDSPLFCQALNLKLEELDISLQQNTDLPLFENIDLNQTLEVGEGERKDESEGEWRRKGGRGRRGCSSLKWWVFSLLGVHNSGALTAEPTPPQGFPLSLLSYSTSLTLSLTFPLSPLPLFFFMISLPILFLFINISPITYPSDFTAYLTLFS